MYLSGQVAHLYSYSMRGHPEIQDMANQSFSLLSQQVRWKITCGRFGVWGQAWKWHMFLLTLQYSELVVWLHLDARGLGNVIFLDSQEVNKLV